MFTYWAQGPDKGGRGRAMSRGGTVWGAELLVKRSNNIWSITNEPEVRFRLFSLMFQILVKVGATIGLGSARTIQNVPEFPFSEIFKVYSSLIMHCHEIIPS